VGGAVGVAMASSMQLVSVSTVNWQSFSELAFRFELTPAIGAAAMAFALGMGLLGGVLPAAQAARMKIVDALRAV
jgi:ABC-type antimicrobial peptide transport system permease subunit